MGSLLQAHNTSEERARDVVKVENDETNHQGQCRARISFLLQKKAGRKTVTACMDNDKQLRI